MSAPSLRSVDTTRAGLLAVLVVSVAVYLPTVRYGFAYDDHTVIVENRFIRSLDQLPTLVSSPEWLGSGTAHPDYRPLTDATYALNHAASGLSPWSYHATNILLHALAAALLLVVGLRLGLGPTGAGAAALLFAIHPIHVEAVANVIGRKDILAAIFALVAVLLHRRALLLGGAAVAWPALAFAGAMLSKESGIVAVGLVALHDLAQRRPDGTPVPLRRRAVLYGGYALALTGYLLLYRWVMRVVPDVLPTLDDNMTAHVGAAVRVMTAVSVIGKGLALQLVPMGQSPDWSYQAIPLVTSPADPRFVATVAALGAWLGVGIAIRRRTPLVLVGLAWYLGTLLPVSNLLFPIGTVFGERLLYLPSAGLALAAGAGLGAIESWKPRLPLRVGLVGGAVALCAATLSYSRAWTDDLSVFRRAVATVPRSSHAHAVWAELLLGGGQVSAALAEAERAVALNPWNGSAHLLRAKALHDLGRFDEERQANRAALAHAGGDAEVTLRPPDTDEVRALRAAVETSPTNADALCRLASLARDAGQLEEAAGFWQRALVVNPSHAAALNDLAGYYVLLGKEDMALALYRRAADADGTLPSAWYMLGQLYAARGDGARSREAFGRFVATAGPEYAAEAETVRRMLNDESR